MIDQIWRDFIQAATLLVEVSGVAVILGGMLVSAGLFARQIELELAAQAELLGHGSDSLKADTLGGFVEEAVATERDGAQHVDRAMAAALPKSGQWEAAK